MRIREAFPDDGPALVQLFLNTPLHAGACFVLDRSPDFFAITRPASRSRTYVVECDGRIDGVVTALVRDADDAGRPVKVGEIVDFRIATRARGTRAAYLLLRHAHDALQAEEVDWATCLIADRNQAAVALVRGAGPLPPLGPIDHWASIHYAAWRAPRQLVPHGVIVRRAGAADRPALDSMQAASTAGRRLREPRPDAWSEEPDTHHAWVAEDTAGNPIGGLVVRDGGASRRIRILRYARTDHLLRVGMSIAGAVGVATPLPQPGGALRMWASCWIGAVESARGVFPGLLYTAIREAARAGVHIVQINVSEKDAIRRALPRSPASTFWSTVYGRALRPNGRPIQQGDICYVDMARV